MTCFNCFPVPENAAVIDVVVAPQEHQMRVSVIQMSPGSDKTDNIAQADRLINACVAADNPDLVILPEIWTCLGGSRQDKTFAAETVLLPESDAQDGPAFQFLRDTARHHRIHVHGGSIGERDGDKLLNTSLLFAPDGNLVARYSKMHLFDITTPDGVGYRESEVYRAGDTVVSAEMSGRFGTIRLGLAICYDVRFGEMFHRLRQEGVELVLLPAAFTAETGAAHWETLIRARAIDTQCWFAAAATTGQYRDADGHDRRTYGHSMIVDPWGTIVAQASVGQGWATSRIDRAATARVRAGMPVMEHRRLL